MTVLSKTFQQFELNCQKVRLWRWQLNFVMQNGSLGWDCLYRNCQKIWKVKSMKHAAFLLGRSSSTFEWPMLHFLQHISYKSYDNTWLISKMWHNCVVTESKSFAMGDEAINWSFQNTTISSIRYSLGLLKMSPFDLSYKSP